MPKRKKEVIEEEKKSPEEILFPEARVGKIIVKPWSFGKLFEVSALLEKVLDKAESKGIDLDDIDALLEYSSIVRLFTLASEELLEIVALTINEDVTKVREFSMEQGILLAIVIAKQNWTTIKNVLSPLLQGMKTAEVVEKKDENQPQK